MRCVMDNFIVSSGYNERSCSCVSYAAGDRGSGFSSNLFGYLDYGRERLSIYGFMCSL